MASPYGTLGILVEALTRPFESQMDQAATRAGDKAAATVSGRMSKGLGRLAPVAGTVGKSIATGLGLATTAAVAFGVKSFKAYEDVAKGAAQTAAVLKSTGGAANVTAAGIDKLTGSLMAKTGVDDDVIRSGSNMLLTFTHIRNEAGRGNDIFNQSTSVLTDMTAAMNHGNVTQEAMSKTAIQLGKALNDPIKGISALQRVGVTFTDQQKNQIATLVQSGHQLDAQKIILRELNREFGGSAAATQTFSDRLKVAYQNVQEAIGGVLSKALDPLLSRLSRAAVGFTAMIGPGGKLAPIMTAIGQAATAAIGPVSSLLGGLTRWFQRLKPDQIARVADAIKRFGPALAGVGAAAAVVTGGGLLSQLPVFGPLITGLLGPLKSLVGLIGGEAGLAGAFAKLTGPWGIVLAIFTTLMTVSPQFRQAVMGLVQSLITGLMPAFKAIFAALKPLMPVITLLGRQLGALLAPVIKALTPLLVSLTPLITELAVVVGMLLKVVLALVMPVLKVYIAFQKWYFAKLLIPILNLLVGALTWLVRVIVSVVKWILGGSPGLVPAFLTLAKVVVSVTNLIKSVVITGFNAIKNAIVAAWRFITSASITTWNAIRSVVTGSIRALVAIVGNGIATVRGLISRGLSAALGVVRAWGGSLLSLGRSAIGNLLHGIAAAMAGIGSWIKAHVVDPVVNAVKSFFGIHSPSEVMASLGENVSKGFISGLVRQNPLTVAKHIFGGIPNALGALVTKGIVSIGALPGKALSALGKVGGFLRGALTKVGGLFGKLFGGGHGGGVMQWAGLMRAVLAHFGIPQLFGTFMAQMQTESGGNPNAINLWDSNAKAGIPSQGLMQVIPPTFAAYAGPYRSRGIRDPLANIYAAVAYAIARYGASIGAVLGHGHGYATGGPILEPLTDFGHRSGQMYQFGEAGPEWVTPMNRLGRGRITIHVHPQKGQSEVEIAAAVSRRLAWAEQTGR